MISSRSAAVDGIGVFTPAHHCAIGTGGSVSAEVVMNWCGVGLPGMAGHGKPVGPQVLFQYVWSSVGVA